MNDQAGGSAMVLLVTIALIGCVDDSEINDTDTDTYFGADTGAEVDSDTETEIVIEAIESREYCGGNQCRPSVFATCVSQFEIMKTIPFCVEEDFYCLCINEQTLKYPAQDPIKCERECRVNTFGGQDLCGEDLDMVMERDTDSDPDNDISQYYQPEYQVVNSEDGSFVGTDWDSYYPSGRKIFWIGEV